MLKTLIVVLTLSFCGAGMAQASVLKPDTLTVEQLKDTGMTAEKLLKLPAAYTVVCCDIIIQKKDGQVFSVFYRRGGLANCPNSNANNFPKLWSGQVKWLTSPETRITLGQVKVQKGEKEMKWMPKTFVVP